MPEPAAVRDVVVRGRPHRAEERGRSDPHRNLAFACSGCNAPKYNKTRALDPVSGEVVALYHPRQDRFRDHFTWSDDFTRMLGIAPRGRATVEALHLNHEGVTNLRRLLQEAGRHPMSEPEEKAAVGGGKGDGDGGGEKTGAE